MIRRARRIFTALAADALFCGAGNDVQQRLVGRAFAETPLLHDLHELATRSTRALGLRPRRTIRFVLFTDDEQGMWASAGYVLRHAAEMDQHNAVVVFDMGRGGPAGSF